MQNRVNLRRIRLISGLVLFVYVTTHFLNHALGLISHEALAGGRAVFLFVWRNPVGTLVLYGAALAHLALALWSFYQRRNLRGLTRADWSQLLLGLAIGACGFVQTSWMVAEATTVVVASMIWMVVFSYLKWLDDPERLSPASISPSQDGNELE